MSVTRGALRCACPLLALALAGTASGGRAFAAQETGSPVPKEGTSRKLGDDLDREIAALRRVLARSEETGRRARALLESLDRLLRNRPGDEQAYAPAESRRSGIHETSDDLRGAKGEKALQAARMQERTKAVAALRAAVAAQDAEHAKLKREISALEHERDAQTRRHPEATASPDDAHAAIAAHGQKSGPIASPFGDQRSNQEKTSPTEKQPEPADALLDRQSLSESSDQPLYGRDERIAALEAELREIRGREQATQAEAEELRQALVTEQQASRSKLEALQSVLQNTRHTGAGLRVELDEARQKNAELSRRVGELKADVLRVHALREKYMKQELESPGVVPESSGDQKIAEPSPQAGEAMEMPSVADTDSTQEDLREQLSTERERRETLEQEIQRLTASGDAEQKFLEAWKALQVARSEILVLSTQLNDERKNRENLEIKLAHLQDGNETATTSDAAQQLGDTLQQRREEAERLAEQLKSANEIIVRLRGRLEATSSPAAESQLISDLDKENTDLRDALKTAQEANTSLRAKAEMAEHLAEMVYGNAH
jgi:chromosome segregation ATPase